MSGFFLTKGKKKSYSSRKSKSSVADCMERHLVWWHAIPDGLTPHKVCPGIRESVQRVLFHQQHVLGTHRSHEPLWDASPDVSYPYNDGGIQCGHRAMGTEYFLINYVLFMEYLLNLVLMREYSAKKDHSLLNPEYGWWLALGHQPVAWWPRVDLENSVWGIEAKEIRYHISRRMCHLYTHEVSTDK